MRDKIRYIALIFSETLRTLGRASRLLESPIAVLGATIVLFWIGVAIFSPLLAPYSPNANNFEALADPTPSMKFWLGTDNQGRDILSRIIWGARTALTVTPLVVLCAYLFGCTLGLISGYYPGTVDDIIMRICDILLSFPVLILYILIITRMGASTINIILAITITGTPQISRIVRSLVLDIRNRDYISAALVRGESPLYIMFFEILPNARGPLVVDACLRMGYTIIAIGVLGFLGLGLPPPNPDWGSMVKDTYSMISVWPHMSLAPCIAICSLVLGFNFLADGLQELSSRD